MIQDIAIGLGLVVNLVSMEVFGLPSGGFIVPGYLALYLHRPLRVAATFGLALATWAAVRFLLGRIMILYGRRRFAVTVLTGFVISMSAELLIGKIPGLSAEFRGIGHLIPGLLAVGMLSEGVLPTSAAALGGAAIVRAILALLGSAGL
jgi:poly-gamma-glutamate biosynthesis protein PgsC/CapC